MSLSKAAPLVIQAWTIFAHPLFLTQLDALPRQVKAFKQKNPVGYVKKNASKRLAAITKLAFDVIPKDPPRPECRQGNTLSGDHKHWFRAKFFQQYQLFFRYHAPSKVIVFAWVNDEDTKRAYESINDACRVFRKMLESGHPPDDWHQLLAEARAEGQRLRGHHAVRLGFGGEQRCHGEEKNALPCDDRKAPRRPLAGQHQDAATLAAR